ncbi:MAG TPA: MerR family transcriptional regulator [Edaphocola sp.]|nr:MerR family transcriptional regulator [Edaphocola sp.]
MSIQLPTLFDDDAFLVPDPKKESKNETKVQTIKKDTKTNEKAQASDDIEITEHSETFESKRVLIELPTEREDKEGLNIKNDKKNLNSENNSEASIIFEFPDEETEEPDPSLKKREAHFISPEAAHKALDLLYQQELILQDYALYADLSEPIAKNENPEDHENAISEEKEDENEKQAPLKEELESIDIKKLDFSFEDESIQTAQALPEFELENKYYSISDVANMFNVKVSHIRFWTKEFDLKVRTTRKGDRLYNPENIARLRLIHHLVKENGFTIKGAKEKLKLQKESVDVNIDLRENLSILKEKLETIKRNL